MRTSHFDGISVSVSLAKGKRYWGTQRVARVCQVSPATVANWIDQGLLKGHKTPTGRRRVDAQDLTSFLRAHAMAVPTELEGKNGHDVVVVVDDDPGYLQALVMMIERSEPDVEVVEAATGMDALLEIGRVQPSVIVLDYSLPDLNAPQVIERLLAPGRLDAEVIVVTGGMPDEAAGVLRRFGVKVILNKAEGMPAVVEALGTALKRQRGKAA